MTSVAFIAGCVPLLLGHGAGSEVREAIGVTVLAGMLGVTLFGLFLTPVFYVALRKWSDACAATEPSMTQAQRLRGSSRWSASTFPGAGADRT
jgi:multidrug efflux pump